MSSERRAVGLATLAYVTGLATHMTFAYYLAPLALRAIGVHDRDAWVFSGVAIAMLLAVVPAGWLADRVPRRHVLAAGLALQSLVMVPLVIGSPSFGFILLSTALTGAGLGLMVVSFNSYVADMLAAEQMGAAYGTTAAATIVGSALGPLLAALLLLRAGPIALAGAPFIAFSVFGAMLALALPTAPRAHPDAADRSTPPTRRAARTVIAVMVTYVVLGAGYGMTAPYFTTYFLDTLHVADDLWGFALAAGTAFSAVGAFALARQADRGRGNGVIFAAQLALALACAAFAFPVGVALLLVAYLVRSAASNVVSPVINAHLARAVGSRSRAQAQGFGSLAWNAGWALGGAVGGALLVTLGGASFAFGGALGLAGVAVGLWMLRETALPAPRQ